MSETITITDNRTGESVEIPLVNGAVDSSYWKTLMPGTWFLDPAFGTTASTTSAITFLDGGAGRLEYRGYPIDQLAENSSHLEVAHLLLKGELPTSDELDTWVDDVTHHTYLHENFRRRIHDAFHYDAHPMGLLTSSVAGLSTFYPDSKEIEDPEVRMAQITRLVAKMPTLAASAYRFSRGLPFVFPRNDLDYTSNFLSMMFSIAEDDFVPDPALRKAMEILFILHADHEQNCSTTAARVVGSAHADPYVSVAAACAALYGPRHGGANEAVLRMLAQIGSYENVPAYMERVKSGEERLMGFGHRVYKNYDPRAKIIKEAAHEVFAVTGKNPLLDIALKLEEVALADPYFIERKLYPNVDFYSGLIYQSMGFPVEMFTVLFAIPRTVGWLAHWQEMLEQQSRIARPRQVYTGAETRDYVGIDAR